MVAEVFLQCIWVAQWQQSLAAPIDHYAQGFPFSAAQELCTSAGTADHYSNGFAFDAAGRVIV